MIRCNRLTGCGAPLLAACVILAAAPARGQAVDVPAARVAADVPYWAFAVDPPAAPASAPAAPLEAQPRRVPGSDAAFTPAQLHDLYGVPDWHPGTHPPMPAIVAHGRKPGVYACGFCHLPNGQGRPENSSLAGLTASYIAAQVADFRNGLRKSSEPRHLPTALMGGGASEVGPEELAVAADYFAGLMPRAWIRVVETDAVPRTRV